MNSSAHIQKIYSTSYYVCLQIRIPGENIYIYIGKGSGHEGVVWGRQAPPPILRKQDTLRDYLRKHLSSSYISNLYVDTKDRVFVLNYQKMGKNNSVSFFWKGRDCYFSHQFFDQKNNEYSIFKSWSERESIDEVNNESLCAVFDEIGRTAAERKYAEKLISEKSILDNELKAVGKSIGVSKKKKKIESKINNIKNDLVKIRGYKEIEKKVASEEFLHEVDRLNMMKESGVKIKFSPSSNSYQKRDLVYKKIKSLKVAEKIQLKRLEQTEMQLKGIGESIGENRLRTILPIWKKSKTKKVHTKLKFKEVEYKAMRISFGQSDKENDELRKNWSSKEDYWFHLEDRRSAHVIIKNNSNENMDESFFQFIGKLFIKLQKLDTMELNLVYTKVKNLKGVKGKAGSVTYKKEKHRKVIIIS